MAVQLLHTRLRTRASTALRWLASVAAGGGLLLLVPLALAQDDPAPGTQGVGLGQLLKLPDTYRVEAASRKRGTEDEWRGRFERAASEIEDAKRDLTRLQERMASMAGETSAYQMTAPGLGGGGGGGGGSSDGENSPMSFPLRERIRQAKEALTQAKRDQRDLVVQANLAGIPEQWREISAPGASPAPSE